MIESFPYSSRSFRAHVLEAIKGYWQSRGTQRKNQVKRGVVDVGARSEVTGGGHLNGMGQLVCDIAFKAGYTSEHIRFSSGVDLPGYYRPSKKWDIVIVKDGRLCAVIEMKSQKGPSFGNNFNNRVEEAIGSAEDLWTAFREGAIGGQAPWLGYIFLLEDARKSRRPVKTHGSTFPPLAVFTDTSYADRYEILCQRLMLERKYNAATLLLSPDKLPATFTQPECQMTIEAWARSLYGHLIGCL